MNKMYCKECEEEFDETVSIPPKSELKRCPFCYSSSVKEYKQPTTFLEWLNENYVENNLLVIKQFEAYPDEMKSGFYIKFFNTKQFRGERFFDYVFNTFHLIKIPGQTTSTLIELALQKCKRLYNELNID